MPWDNARPRADRRKYGPEHTRYLDSLKAALREEGALTCTARECILPSRAITNPNGRDRDGLTAGHNDTADGYDGPQHRACNIRDGAKRARSRQLKGPSTLRW